MRAAKDGGSTETSSDHFDHWLRFGLPYLLVLHDEKNKKSYWAHVNHDNIIATDNGRKIFVSKDQRIDEALTAELNEVAVSRRAEAFSQLHLAGADLTPGQRLRHAIITPHLIIPDLGTPKRLTYDQVVAMLLLDRRFEISYGVRAGVCPDPATWRTHKGWGWRFAQALWEVLNGTGRISRPSPPGEKRAVKVRARCLSGRPRLHCLHRTTLHRRSD